MEIIVQKSWDYTFSRNTNGQLILSVLCGTVGLFEIDIILNQDETTQYNKDGEAFIEQLAKQIRDNPHAWSERKTN
jgi:hypothetical protein